MLTIAFIVIMLAIVVILLRYRALRAARRRRAEELCLRVQRLFSHEDDKDENFEQAIDPNQNLPVDYLILNLRQKVDYLLESRGKEAICAGWPESSRKVILTKLALQIEILEMGIDAPSLPSDHYLCNECWQGFPESLLILFSGYRVCEDCKPRFLQKLKEGAHQF